MEDNKGTTEALIAPHEVRELLTRLTEQSTEGIQVHEARTLSGLALETGIPVDKLRTTLGEMRGRPIRWAPIAAAGIVLMGALAWWLFSGAAPPRPIITTGLQSLTAVTYGPEGGPLRADPSFVPDEPLPPGISVAAITSNIVWGTGDHHAQALTAPLTDEQESLAHSTIVALLKHVRKSATERQLPTSKALGNASPRGEPGMRFEGESYATSVMIRTYSGAGMVTLDLPTPTGGSDADTEKIVQLAATKALSRLKNLLDQSSRMRGSNSTGRRKVVNAGGGGNLTAPHVTDSYEASCRRACWYCVFGRA